MNFRDFLNLDFYISMSEWTFSMFTIPKGDKSLRSLVDLRKSNSSIRRKAFPVPKINDLFQNLKGFCFLTSLDLNIGYLTLSSSLIHLDFVLF
jgi:hypothetical protein